MRPLLASLLLLLAPLAACSGSASASGGDLLGDLRTAAVELAARPEHQAEMVEVQHILVAHGGAGISGVTRSLPEAEALAAEIFGRVRAGEDFGKLVDQSSDDPGRPGIYVMVADARDTASHPGSFARRGMVPAFGNVGWRLEVGEVGIAPYDEEASPYGWHIVKRLK